MGRRCLTIMDGKPCPLLAQDGTCLLDEGLLKEGCSALEKVIHERKDEWMRRKEKKELNISVYKGKE